MSGIIGQTGRSGIIGPAETARVGFGAFGASSYTLATAWNNISFTQIWDLGGCYDGTTFTAPVTGKYFFSARAWFTGLTAGDNCYFRLSGGGRTYYSQQYRSFGTTTDSNGNIAVVADMDANDTMVVQGYNATGTRGAISTSDNTGFHGWLLGY